MSGMTVELNGKRYEVPLAVEAEGGAAVERWLAAQLAADTDQAPKGPKARG